jgi:hypothetical protein
VPQTSDAYKRYLKKVARFKKGSGTVVRSTLRAVPATVPDPFLNRAKKLDDQETEIEQRQAEAAKLRESARELQAAYDSFVVKLDLE